ncbi:MAG: hypothetical protein ACHQRJ_15280 [Alphaproteobacteria bacterium]
MPVAAAAAIGLAIGKQARVVMLLILPPLICILRRNESYRRLPFRSLTYAGAFALGLLDLAVYYARVAVLSALGDGLLELPSCIPDAFPHGLGAQSIACHQEPGNRVIK